MPRQPAYPGYQRIPGTARNYVNTSTGAIITDRQYRKLGAKAPPVSPRRRAIQVRAQRNYNRLLNDYVKEQRAHGATSINSKGQVVPLTKADARKRAEMKQIIADIKISAQTPAGEARRRAALTAAGLRKGIPEWVPVGLSGRYKAGKLRRDRIPKAFRPVVAPSAPRSAAKSPRAIPSRKPSGRGG